MTEHLPERRAEPGLALTAARAAIASVPIVGSGVQVFFDWGQARFENRILDLEEEALAQCTTEALAEALADERRSRAIVRAASIAGLSDWERKRRVLSGVVRAVIDGDDADLDDAELLVDALADLERPHIALLVRLSKAQEAPDKGVQAKDLRPPAHPSAISGLVRHGAISGDGFAGGMTFNGAISYGVTPFGRELLRLLG
jgi:hypothetical protein